MLKAGAETLSLEGGPDDELKNALEERTPCEHIAKRIDRTRPKLTLACWDQVGKRSW